MKLSFFILVASAQVALGQGWQRLGPDSVNWRESYYLTGRWLTPSTFHLAASTSKGVALYSSEGTWDYTLHHIPESYVGNGVSFALLEFSPWEPDSCFVGYYIAYTEADLHIRKAHLPPQYSSAAAGAHGSCWMGPLSVVVPPDDNSVVYAGICGVQKSTDRGLTWQSTLDESPVAISRLIGVDESDPRVVYRATEGQSSRVLYRSPDGGLSWDSLFSPLPTTGYYARNTSVIAHGDTILLAMWRYPSDTSETGAIARSTDRGTSWSVSNNFGRVSGLASASNATYAAVTAGIIRSTDRGSTWTPFNNALPTTSLTCILADPSGDTVYVSTRTDGVLKVWRFTTGITNGRDSQPAGFSLFQNYPNPFNPSTNIQFLIVNRQLTILKVFDLLGREVATLVNEVKEPGTYTVEFDTRLPGGQGSGLSSGVYFCRMQVHPVGDGQAPDLMAVKKILLLR